MPAICPECHTPVPGDAGTMGLCPRCLLSQVMGGLGGNRAVAGKEGPQGEPTATDLAVELPDFDIIEPVGRGGMGVVFRAVQRAGGRDVAIKVIARDQVRDPAFGQRFAQEARVLSRLNHANVVSAFDSGETPRYWFLVMEWVDGGNLRDLLRQRRLEPAVALRIALQVCEALAYAHRQGVIHRDIKPENILILGKIAEPGWRVRVADFGLAKLAGPSAAEVTLTAAGERLGTPYYMAPEQQSRPHEVDARADVYALGVVLYEMLAGELPVGRFAPPSAVAKVDARWDAVVLRCLEKDPARRFTGSADLRSALIDLLGGAQEDRRHRMLGMAVAAAVAVLGFVALGVVVAVTLMARKGAAPALPAVASAAEAQPASLPAPAPGSLPPPPLPPPPAATQTAPREPLPPPVSPFLARMIQEHGADRIATVQIDRLPGDMGSFIPERLQALTRCSALMIQGSWPSVTIHLAPVRDLEPLWRQIDFGTVRKVDQERRVIQVDADPKRLPPPLKPAVKEKTDPAFYSRNAEDLGSWDHVRRREAAARLKTAEPNESRKQVAAALAKLLSDKDARREAAEALMTWATDAQVETLIEHLNDEDRGVRHGVIKALGNLRDARAAEPLARLLATDRAEAAAALRQLGAPAEASVAGRLKHTDHWVRVEAAKILADIGTEASQPALEAAAATHDGFLPGAARDALAAIRSRAKSGSQ